MRIITFREALREALLEEMELDKNVVLIGEDIGIHDGPFQVTAGLFKKFGGDRVRNTPISEVAIAGTAIGAAAVGLRPVAEFMFDDFLFCAGDQIVNQMAKLRFMTGGQIKLPLVIRMPMGAGLSQAAQHAQCVMGMFMNVPGLKIVCPSTPYDAKGALKASIRDDSPVLFFEHLTYYNIKGDVPENDYLVPLGKASIKKEGKDVTIVAIAEMVKKSLNVANRFEKEGISIEVIDPISLIPLDMDTIINSVKKTNKVLIAYNGPKTNGAGAEISARLNEEAFEYLDAPIYRIAEKDCPIPFSPKLEKVVLPQEEDIENAIKKLFNK
ncbi:MAG: alpha-ketoacid dehydrogenase subunit beta [Actinobacteria bacterium]|nr:alpha-ketoacid dehydrogenase subunit beta [Actinomycetota bacterium]